MFLKTKGKQRYIRSALTLALTGILTVGTIFSTGQPVMARKTLPGIEKIIQSNSKENPFVILEIIPEEQYASLGYFGL